MRVDAEGYGTFFRTLKCTAICICDFAASGCPNISMPNKNTVWENSWGDGILGRGDDTGYLEKCKDELLGKFILRQNTYFCNFGVLKSSVFRVKFWKPINRLNE